MKHTYLDANNTVEEGMSVTMYRYVNGVPLADWHDDASCCGMSLALKAIKWSSYGLSLSLEMNASSADQTSIMRPSRWRLQYSNFSSTDTVYAMTVICDLQSNHGTIFNIM